MKTDSKFNELNPNGYIEDLGADYTRMSFLADKIEEGFKPEGDELMDVMDDSDAHVEVEFRGQRLFIDEVIKKVSANGVKKMVIHVDERVL
jgi:hypothetical protein